MWKSKIDKHYITCESDRLIQGDILRDIKLYCFDYIDKAIAIPLVAFQYIVLISQDCDLEQGHQNLLKIDENKEHINQYLHNVIFLPAFTLDDVKNGTYLAEIFNLKTAQKKSDDIKKIRQNQVPRFHFLHQDPKSQVPELIIDFKVYYSLPYKYILAHYNNTYLTTMNELFRESLALRFYSYMHRIGLPNINN